MNPVDPRITRFIKKHHIFTLATASGNIPYTCTCFYVYLENENRIVFTSEYETRHIRELNLQPAVAGAIALETMVIGRIQGIQFTGQAMELKDTDLERARIAYLLKFPVAAFKELLLWGIDLEFIKMTHNQLGFGKKLTWQKNP